MKSMELEDCQYIVSEFDNNRDGFLQYEEFLNIVTPATLPDAGYTIGRSKSSNQQIDSSILALAAQIIFLEGNLGQERLNF